MAYGKDPSVLSDIGNFHQNVAAFGNRGERKATRGGLRFSNIYKPSEQFTDTVRLIPGDYDIEYANDKGELQTIKLGFQTFVEHFSGRTKKGGICSAGPFAQFREKREPCLGCDIFWDEVQRKVKPRSMGKRDMYVFNVLDYDTYYEVEQVDRQTGQIRLKDDKTPWMEWVKGVGRNDLAKAGKNSKKGHLCHWAMGHGHYTSLLAANEMIGEGCKSCGCKIVNGMAAIQSLAWLCSNPNCGEAIIDLSDTELNGDEIKKLTKKPMTCKRCRHMGMANEAIECLNCANPVRACIFDVDLQLRKVKTAKGEDGNQTQLMVVGWSDPGPINDAFVKQVEKLYDLPKLYAPSSMEDQQRLFGEAPAAPATRAYGNAPGGNRYGG